MLERGSTPRLSYGGTSDVLWARVWLIVLISFFRENELRPQELNVTQ